MIHGSQNGAANMSDLFRLSDVQLASGPVCMVPGSQNWPDAEGGNFFGGDLEEVKKICRVGR